MLSVPSDCVPNGQVPCQPHTRTQADAHTYYLTPKFSITSHTSHQSTASHRIRNSPFLSPYSCAFTRPWKTNTHTTKTNSCISTHVHPQKACTLTVLKFGEVRCLNTHGEQLGTTGLLDHVCSGVDNFHGQNHSRTRTVGLASTFKTLSACP